MKQEYASLEESLRSGNDVTVPPFLQNWLNQPKKNLCGDTFVEGKESFSSINPATGEELATLFLAGKKEVDLAVAAAKTAFETGSWAQSGLEHRASVLRRIGDLLLEHKAPLALLESLDTGKPIRESLEGDIPRAARNFHFFADFALQEKLPSFPTEDALHSAYREPVGVVALVTPWNLPLYLESWKLAPCLLMGNSCVLKPSECTPLTAAYFAEIILAQVDLPPGVFNLVQGFGENSTGEFLVSHPDVNAISFTGETRTGQAIMKSAASGPARVSFELGGKGASIVFADADLEKALEGSLQAAFRNQGEICLACPRLYIEKSIYAEFAEKFALRAKALRVGNPLNFGTQMGALISREHYEKVTGFLSTVESPARITCGGKRPEGLSEGNFLEPTVLEGVPEDHPVTQKEIFGPVVSLYPFETEQEVIGAVNSTPYGLSASLWTGDPKRVGRLTPQLRVGLLWVNCWFVRDLRVPFGGQKKSGLGREGGHHSLDFYSEWKSVCIKQPVT